MIISNKIFLVHFQPTFTIHILSSHCYLFSFFSMSALIPTYTLIHCIHYLHSYTTHTHTLIHYRDVRIDTNLNKFVWSQGVKNVAKRIRVRLSRKRNDDEDAKEQVRYLICSFTAPLPPHTQTHTHFAHLVPLSPPLLSSPRSYTLSSNTWMLRTSTVFRPRPSHR